MKQKLFGVLFFSLLISFSCSSSDPTVNIVEVSYDFGVVYVNDSASHDFVLENKTNNTVSVISARIEGSNEFVITSGGTGTSIPPKNILNLTVEFEPVNKGFEQATLFILHSESNKELEIKLEATGDTKPEFDIDQTSYDFGTAYKGLTKSQDFTVSNVGTAILTLTTIGISGPDSADFTVILGGTTPVNIDPGLTHVITVKWESADPVGMKSAYLDINHNAQGTSQSVTLAAETLAIPPLVLVTTTLKDGNNWKPYEDTLVTNGGTGNNTFSVITGSLPVGISLDSSTGKISGTPRGIQKCDFEVEVDDGITNITRQLSIDVKSTNGWLDVTPKGATFSGAECITSYNNKMYYFSGYSNIYDIFIFDPIMASWQSSNTKLAYHHQLGNACVYDKYIYVISGSKTNAVERYDPAADTIATDTPAPLQFYDFAVGVYNKEIYCISGANGSYTSAYKFTPGPNGTNGVWTTLPNTTTSCFGAGMTIYNNSIVMFGGYSGGNLSAIRTYDPATGNETSVGTLNNGAGRFAWGRIGNILYIGVGGATTFQKYDLSTNAGASLPASPVTSIFYSSQNTECDGRIYVSDKKTKLYAYIP